MVQQTLETLLVWGSPGPEREMTAQDHIDSRWQTMLGPDLSPSTAEGCLQLIYLTVLCTLSSPLLDLPLLGPKPHICKQGQWVMIVVSAHRSNPKRTRALC